MTNEKLDALITRLQKRVDKGGQYADVHQQDLDDVVRVKKLLRQKKFRVLRNMIKKMDTAPREELLLTLPEVIVNELGFERRKR